MFSHMFSYAEISSLLSIPTSKCGIFFDQSSKMEKYCISAFEDASGFFSAYFLIWGKGCSKNPYSFHAASYIVQFSRTRRDYEIENNTERIQTQNKDNIQPLLGRYFLIFKSLAIGNHDEIIFGKKLRSQDLVVTLFKLCPYNSQLNWRVLHKAAAFCAFMSAPLPLC